MTDPIRTPLDEKDEPGHFYPPFKEPWTYEGQTYPGHSDYAVDWNRRTSTGGWLQDDGDPVLAAADGRVAVVDRAEGLVMLNHGFLWRTEYRHMKDIAVKVGDTVERGDRIGSIGSVGNSTSPHLHHRHYRRPAKGKPFEPVQMRFEGQPVRTSVGNSDTQPAGWTPPEPVLLQGPPPKATWRSAFEEAKSRLERAERREEVLEQRLATVRGTLALVTDERDEARRALEACQPADCTAIEAERDGALARAQQEQERAETVTAQLDECEVFLRMAREDRDRAEERAKRAEAELDACELASAADEAFRHAVEEALAARRAAT